MGRKEAEQTREKRKEISRGSTGEDASAAQAGSAPTASSESPLSPSLSLTGFAASIVCISLGTAACLESGCCCCSHSLSLSFLSFVRTQDLEERKTRNRKRVESRCSHWRSTCSREQTERQAAAAAGAADARHQHQQEDRGRRALDRHHHQRGE